MHFFIAEGGLFTPETGWGVVSSLALPHKQVGPARREINRISRGWPRKDGELKGGQLQPAHLDALVDILFRHDALLYACAIDVSREAPGDVEYHKARQCEGTTKHLTAEHQFGRRPKHMEVATRFGADAYSTLHPVRADE